MTEHRFVFVGGMHRSGTSLVHRLLRAHPDVSGFSGTGAAQDEGQHLQDVFPTGRDCGGPGRFGLGPGGHLTERDAAAMAHRREDLWRQWAEHWDLDRPVLVEKSPPNLVRTRFLQALFDPSWFVIVIRHPLVSCMATEKWAGGLGLEALLEHWLACHETLRDDAGHLRRLHTLHYEALVADPPEVLEGLARFVGLDGGLGAGEVDARASDGYARRWQAMQRRRSGRRRVEQLTERFEQRVRSFGYSLSDLGGVEPVDLSSRTAL